MAFLKPIVFLGDSLARLREFPDDARQDMGRELARVQERRERLETDAGGGQGRARNSRI